MIRLVLFDIDGTLIRTGGAGMAAFTLTGEQAFGVLNGTGHMKFAGRTDTSLVREFFVSHGLETNDANVTRFFEHYLSILGETLAAYQGAPCAGVEAFLEGLSSLSQPPRIGLLTGNIRRGAEIKLRHFGLWGWFEMGAYGDDHEDRNQIAHVALRRGRELLGEDLQPDELLVVGDTPRDVECGRAVGAKVLAVATGGASHEDLQASQPDWLVGDLTQAAVAEICRS